MRQLQTITYVIADRSNRPIQLFWNKGFYNGVDDKYWTVMVPDAIILGAIFILRILTYINSIYLQPQKKMEKLDS